MGNVRIDGPGFIPASQPSTDPNVAQPPPGFDDSSFDPGSVTPAGAADQSQASIQTVPADFWGFDDTKLNSPLKLGADGQPKSAKYSYGQAVEKYGLPKDDADTERWWNDCIAPAMRADGFQVGPISKESGNWHATICTREEPQGANISLLRTDGIGGSPSTKAVWDDHSGTAGNVAFDNFMDGDFSDLLEALGPGADPGATNTDRQIAAAKARDEYISQARAHGLDVGWNIEVDGSLSTDKLVLRGNDGKDHLIQFETGATDGTQALGFTWRQVDGAAHMSLAPAGLDQPR